MGTRRGFKMDLTSPARRHRQPNRDGKGRERQQFAW
jgi:hypothetical protein